MICCLTVISLFIIFSVSLLHAAAWLYDRWQGHLISRIEAEIENRKARKRLFDNTPAARSWRKRERLKIYDEAKNFFPVGLRGIVNSDLPTFSARIECRLDGWREKP